VSPELGETLAAEKAAGRIEHIAARFADAHLAGATWSSPPPTTPP
jgi:hypothetical protein